MSSLTVVSYQQSVFSSEPSGKSSIVMLTHEGELRVGEVANENSAGEAESPVRVPRKD